VQPDLSDLTHAYLQPDGLERLLRFLQASLQIAVSLLVSPPVLYDTLLLSSVLNNNNHLHQPLAELSGRLGLVRRFLRFFRFLDAFSASYNVFTSPSKDGQPTSAYLEKTMEGLAGTFNGLYLLLEAVTLVDALRIPGLAVWGTELESVLKVESQRCWLFALVAGALACKLRLSRLQDHTPARTVPDKVTQKGTTIDEKENVKMEKERSQSSLKSAQGRRLTRKMVACVLDMALPGSVIGWIPASRSSVAIIMLVTSVLTGLDVWERCGKEVGKQ
jgi:hypothetical protein